MDGRNFKLIIKNENSIIFSRFKQLNAIIFKFNLYLTNLLNKYFKIIFDSLNKLNKFLLILFFYLIFIISFYEIKANIDVNLSSVVCPSNKKISELKPIGFVLNCDCTQTADGQSNGWEIICFFVENIHQLSSSKNNKINLNNDQINNFKNSFLSSTITNNIKFNNSNEVEEVTSDNETGGFEEDKLDLERESFAEPLIASTNLEYLDELSSYRSVPIAFTIKYIKNQIVIIECYENYPNFKPAMFQDFKIDEIDSFKLLNCVLPELPFNILFHRTNLKKNTNESSVTHIRSLKLETLHTQSIDLNQFKKLFANLEFLEYLCIDNYELDLTGKGLRMKRYVYSDYNNDIINKNMNKKFINNLHSFSRSSSTNHLKFFSSLNSSTVNNQLNKLLVDSIKPSNSLNFRATPNNFSLFSFKNNDFNNHSGILFKYSDKIVPITIKPNINSTNRSTISLLLKNNTYLDKFSTVNSFRNSILTTFNDNLSSTISPFLLNTYLLPSPSILTDPVLNLQGSNRINNLNLHIMNKTLVSEENNVPISIRSKSHLMVNMLNRRNNSSRNQKISSSTNIRKLNLNFVHYFPNLKILKLRSLLANYEKDNAYFIQEMLTKLNNLETLELSKNIIQILPKSMFAGLDKLNTIYLNHNQIQLIEKEAFQNLNKLEILELGNNDIKGFETDTFKYLTNLKKIKLKHNNFNKLPENLFFSNIQIQELDISQNKELTILPDNLLQNLVNLNNLSLFDCNLSNISLNPQLFFINAPELKNIYMRNNRLKKLITKNLFAFNSKLIKLDLSYNDISEISSEIFSTNSSSLLELNLYGNNLNEVPNNVFTNLRNLRILNLGYNYLMKIDGSIFFTLKNLEELDLSKNLLTTINPKKYALPFGIGTNLRIVNLSHNKLTSFADEFNVINWSLYLMLNELNISNNLLTGHVLIPFFYSSKMKLDLRVNQITTVLMNEIQANELLLIDHKKSEASFSNKGTQINVYLANNPIVCDCRLFNFVNYTRTSNFKYNNIFEKINFDLDYIECQYPENLKNTLIENLNDAYLSCQIKDTKICPKNCTCEFINKFKQFSIDCQQKGLTKPPSNLFSIANYEEINLDSVKEKFPVKEIDLVSIYLQHNFIKNLELFNKFSFKNFLLSKKRLSPFQLEIYLDNNTISRIPPDFLKNILFLQLLLFNNLESSSSNEILNKKSTFNNLNFSSQQPFSLKTLSLTNNQLQNIPINFFKTLETLVSIQSKKINHSLFKLYFSSNKFNCTPIQTKVNLKNKSTLLLNQIDSDTNSSSICAIKETKNWLTKNYNLVGDLGDIYCFNTLNKNSTRQLIQFTDEQLCPQELEDQTYTMIFLTFCLIITCTLFLITIVYFKNRQTILAFIYIHVNPIFVCLSFNKEDLDKEKLYDAFVSYSSQDRDVVMQLIEHLEKPSKQTSNAINFLQSKTGYPTFHEANTDKIVPDLLSIETDDRSTLKVKTLKNNSNILNQSFSFNSSNNNKTLTTPTMQLNAAIINNDLDEYSDYFKLCIHERDWVPGQFISWNIINSVRNSRRTILILSKNFIESIWFQIEFHTAYYQMLEDKIDRLIVIVKGDLLDKKNLDKDLAFLLSTKTYLVWGEKWFWEKLRYSLPHKKNIKTKNKMLKKPLINSDYLKLHDFGTYSTPNNLSSMNNKFTNKMSSKAKYMQECVDNAIADYYQLNTNNSKEPSHKINLNKKNDVLGIKLKTATLNHNKMNDNKNDFYINQSFEKESNT